MFCHFLALSRNLRKPRQQRQAGFGLIELMVSISVMVVVASVILARQSSFNSAVLLRGQAYEIALAMREVQLSAVSASGDTGVFRTVYGIYFNSASTHNGYYRIFKDDNDDGTYDIGEEFGAIGKLDERFEIREMRDESGTILNDVSVLFARPNFDALFFDGSGGPVTTGSIELDVARRGETGTGVGILRTIEVTTTGQIAVQ